MTRSAPRRTGRQRAVQRTLHAWERRSRLVLGEFAAHWETPQAAILVAAIVRDDDAVPAVHGFVRHRCREGWGLRAVADDLERLRSSLPWRARGVRRWTRYRIEAALAHSDDVVRSLIASTGRDALSGLPNLTFASIYLEELLAAEAGSDPGRAGRSSLLVVSVQPQTPGIVDRMAARIVVADVLRGAVVPELIVAHVANERFVVVLPPLIEATATTEAVRAALDPRPEIGGIDLSWRPLPHDQRELADLLARWRDELVRTDGAGARQPPPDHHHRGAPDR